MHDIRIFENEEFGKVRTLLINGSPWFVGKDVAQILQYQNGNRDIVRHVDEEDRLNLKTRYQNGIEFDYRVIGQRGGWVINESGVYSLILSSTLPTAKKFKRWITSIVLPTIRKYGAYITPEVLNEILSDPNNANQLLHQLKDAQEKVTVMQPKADYYDALVESNHLTSIRITAKELNIPERLFTYLLEEMGFAYRGKNRVLLPYAFMVKEGYAEVKEYTNNGHGGAYMLFTPVGRLYVAKRMAKRLMMKKENMQ